METARHRIVWFLLVSVPCHSVSWWWLLQFCFLVVTITWEISQSLDLPPVTRYAILYLLCHWLILFTYAVFSPMTIPTDRDHLCRHKQVPKYRAEIWNLNGLSLRTMLSYRNTWCGMGRYPGNMNQAISHFMYYWTS